MNKVEQKLQFLQDTYSDQEYKIWWPSAAEDYNANINNKKSCGAYRILAQIDRIISSIKELRLPPGSKILDICCGLPILPCRIKEEFPEFEVYGIDIYTHEYDEFSKYNKGCKIYKFPFQMLFEDSYKNNIDFELVTMFNSFRAFEGDVQESILDWYKNNSKRFMSEDLRTKGIHIRTNKEKL